MILSNRSSKFSLLRDLKRHLKISVPSTQKLECVYTCNFDHFHSLGKPLWSFHVGSRLSLTFEWCNFENILPPDLFFISFVVIVAVQSLSHIQFCAMPCTASGQASLSFTILLSLFKFMSIESVMPSNHLYLCRLLLLLSSIFHNIRSFSNESALF